MQCETCHDLDYNYWPRFRNYPEGKHVLYSELEGSGHLGCTLCSVIVQGLQLFSAFSGSTIESTTPIFFDIRPSQPLLIVIDDSEILEFYTLEGFSSPLSVFGPAKHVPLQLDLDLVLRSIGNWITECDLFHPDCKIQSRSDPFLPSRVLDVDPMRDENSIFVVESAGKVGRYVTLSHCWGTAQVITTTKDTLGQRKEGISLSHLPETFKDVVKITRALGVKYLWIDSLCIIQDDQNDWEKESSLMAAIYSASFLNIAITHSSDSSGGCFITRWVPSRGTFPKLPSRLPVDYYEICVDLPFQTFSVYVRRSLNYGHRELTGTGDGAFGEAQQYGWRPWTDTAPLLSRAWVFQERLLARRTIHFHASELFWDCKSKIRCECGRIGDSPQRIRPNLLDTSSESIRIQWNSIVENYSPLKATIQSDRLPALSGIASQFAEHTRCDYLAGLWSHHLPEALLWETSWSLANSGRDPEWFAPVRSHPYRAPTWSWASVDLQNAHGIWGIPISYYLGSFAIDPRLSILRAECEVTGSNPFGHVTNGIIEIRGAYMTPNLAKSTARRPSNVVVFYFDDSGIEVRFHSDIPSGIDLGLQDSPSSTVPAALEYHCLLIGGTPDESVKKALVLKRSEATHGKFERVGVILFKCPPCLFTNANEGTFQII